VIGQGSNRCAATTVGAGRFQGSRHCPAALGDPSQPGCRAGINTGAAAARHGPRRVAALRPRCWTSSVLDARWRGHTHARTPCSACSRHDRDRVRHSHLPSSRGTRPAAPAVGEQGVAHAQPQSSAQATSTQARSYVSRRRPGPPARSATIPGSFSRRTRPACYAGKARHPPFRQQRAGRGHQAGLQARPRPRCSEKDQLPTRRVGRGRRCARWSRGAGDTRPLNS
jgi:hypothetical protein